MLFRSLLVQMQQSENLRRFLFQQGQATEQAAFSLETQSLRETIAKGIAQRNIAGSEGGVGLEAFDQSPMGQALKTAQEGLAAREMLFSRKQAGAGAGEAATQEAARRSILLKSYDEEINRQVLSQGLEQQRFDITQQFINAELQRKQQSLQLEQSLGLLTGQQVQDRTLLLEKERIDLELQRQLRDVANDRIAAEREFQRVRKAEQDAGRSFQGEFGYVQSPAERIARENRDANIARGEQTAAAAKTGAQANKDFLDQQALLSDRQKAYAAQFNQAFQSMADAIVDFARTGISFTKCGTFHESGSI